MTVQQPFFFSSPLAISFVHCSFAHIFRFSNTQNVRFTHCSSAICRLLFSMMFSWNFCQFFSFSHSVIVQTNSKFFSLFAKFASNLCTIHMRSATPHASIRYISICEKCFFLFSFFTFVLTFDFVRCSKLPFRLN